MEGCRHAPWPPGSPNPASNVARRAVEKFGLQMRKATMLRFILWLGFVLLLAEACLKRCRSQKVTMPKRAPFNQSTVVGKYATYEETIAWYYRLEEENRGLVKLIPIGETYEGRTQMVMRISPLKSDSRPVIFIEGGMHAREWLSPTTANYLIEKMILGYKSGSRWYRNTFKKYVFYFMSITNPDGYVFTFNKSHRSNRYWRKNRRLHANGCYGVDLNRNFDIKFGGKGTSGNPCSEIFRGSGAFSEPESDNVRRFAQTRLARAGIQLYISLHTYAQMWVVPYSFRKARPRPPEKDYELHRAALVASTATQKATGAFYQVKNGAEAFGVTTAGSDDWMLAKMKASYSYTLELRPSSDSIPNSRWREGFNRPASEIIPTGRDALAALKALINTMKCRSSRSSPFSSSSFPFFS